MSENKTGLSSEFRQRFAENLNNSNPNESMGSVTMNAADKIYEKIQEGTKDILTGLENRRGLDRDKNRLEVTRCPYLFISFDLDNLKKINDNPDKEKGGHAFGDLYITSFVKLVNKVFRPSDLKFRLGGDEFLIIVENGNKNKDFSEIISKRIISFLEKFNREEINKESPNELEFTFAMEESRVLPKDISQEECKKEIDRVIKASDNKLVKAKKNKKDQQNFFSDISTKE